MSAVVAGSPKIGVPRLYARNRTSPWPGDRDPGDGKLVWIPALHASRGHLDPDDVLPGRRRALWLAGVPDQLDPAERVLHAGGNIWSAIGLFAGGRAEWQATAIPAPLIWETARCVVLGLPLRQRSLWEPPPCGRTLRLPAWRGNHLNGQWSDFRGCRLSRGHQAGHRRTGSRRAGASTTLACPPFCRVLASTRRQSMDRGLPRIRDGREPLVSVRNRAARALREAPRQLNAWNASDAPGRAVLFRRSAVFPVWRSLASLIACSRTCSHAGTTIPWTSRCVAFRRMPMTWCLIAGSLTCRCDARGDRVLPAPRGRDHASHRRAAAGR